MQYFPLHENNEHLVITNEDTLKKQREAVYKLLKEGKNIYAFFDTETTGTEPYPKKNDHGELIPRDRIIEVGFILCIETDSGDIEKLKVDGEPVVFHEYVNPFSEDPKLIKSFNAKNQNESTATFVHGITPEFLFGKEPLGLIDTSSSPINKEFFVVSRNPEQRIEQLKNSGVRLLPKSAPTFNQIRPYMDDILCLNDLKDLKGRMICIGHNAINFDAIMLSMEMERDDKVFNSDIQYPRMFESMVSDVKDTMIMMKDLFTRNDLDKYKEGFDALDGYGNPMKPGFSMSYLAHMLGVKETGREDFHGALLDSEILMNVFREFIKLPDYKKSPNRIPIKNKAADFLNQKIKSEDVVVSFTNSQNQYNDDNLDILTIIQTDASLQEGTGKVKEYVEAAKESGISSLLMADTCSLLEFVPFYKECEKNDITPLVGGTFKLENFADSIHFLNKNKNYYNKDEVGISPALINILTNFTNIQENDLKEALLKAEFNRLPDLEQAIVTLEDLRDKAVKSSADSLKKAKAASKNKIFQFISHFDSKFDNAKNLDEEIIFQSSKILGNTEKRHVFNRVTDYADATLIAQNDIGFHNIRKLITEASRDGQYWTQQANGKWKTKDKGEYPLLNINNLSGNTDGLTLLVGDFKDVLGRSLKDKDLNVSRLLLQNFKELFGNNIRGDMNLKMLDEESNFKKYENSLLVNAYKFLSDNGIESIVTQHASFAKPEDYKTHKNKEAILLEKSVSSLSTTPNRFSSQYIHSKEKMKELFKNNLDLMNNSHMFINKLSINPVLDNPTLPAYQTSNGVTQSEELIKQANEGLIKRVKVAFEKIWDKYEKDSQTNRKIALKSLYNSVKDALQFSDEEKEIREKFVNLWKDFVSTNDKEKAKRFIFNAYKRRLNYELEIINDMDFPGYFLIMKQMVDFCHNNGIPVGAGRGSGAGSLVVYSLNITNIDPLEYGLIFERFLNPERKEMPDIDTDILGERRDEVLNYLMKEYSKFGEGYEGSAYIITKGTFSAKSTLQAVGKINNLSLKWQYGLSDLVSDEPDIKLIDELQNNEKLIWRYENEPKTKEIIDQALELEKNGGRMKSSGKHAGGIVVGNLIGSCPIVYEKGIPVVQYDKKNCEIAGLVKFDLLGLGTLGKLDLAVKLVNQKENGSQELAKFGLKVDDKFVDYSELDFEDPETYKLICERHTTNVFQIESHLFKELLKRIQPKTIEDIADLVSIGRPGPLESGMDDIYISGSQDPSSVKYDHPLLEPILKETHGAILYQEQVMRTSVDMASYTKGGADKLRKAMGKKIAEAMEEQRELFLNGCKENGIDVVVAEKIFDDMAKFAGYGFNKSHAVAYADLSYKTALMKTHFPVEYATAVLTMDASGNNAAKKLPKNIADIREQGIKVLCPDVNKSGFDFTPLPDKKAILYGLSGIKGGGVTVKKFVEEREKNGLFESMEDVIMRMGAPKALVSLIDSGAMDNLKLSRKVELKNIEQFDSRTLKVVLKRNLLRQEFDILSKALSSIAKRKAYEKSGNKIEIEYQSVIDKMLSNKEATVSKMLTTENELLMSYITAHPLDASNIRAKLQKPNVHPPLRSISDVDLIDNKSENDQIRVAGYVTECDLGMIAKSTGNSYGKFTLDDGIYTRDFVMFSSQIEDLKESCKENLGREFREGDIVSLVGNYQYRENRNTGEHELQFNLQKIEFPKQKFEVDFAAQYQNRQSKKMKNNSL